MPWSMGHDVLSDFADYPVGHEVFGLYKNCGFWTHDEAAILYNCALRVSGDWLDIGAHTGWTIAHAAAAGRQVTGIDTMLRYEAFLERAEENLAHCWSSVSHLSYLTSTDWFASIGKDVGPFGGVVIDGDHERPCPLLDAQNAVKHLAADGVILLHDFIGPPVWEAVVWLLDNGFRCRIYWTPHMVAACWRGNFTPPDHVRDPDINWDNVRSVMSGFPFERCE